MRILVAGAGPAGAVAALELARNGAKVLLVEKRPWPRDKTCGDAISPLGIAEGRAFGVTVEGPIRLSRALVSVPSGVSFRGAWPSATPWGTTIRRRDFDALLVDAAIRNGTQFEPKTSVDRLRPSGNALAATLRAFGGPARETTFDAAIVAEGATGGLAATLGFPRWRSRLVALRGYADSSVRLEPEYGLFFERGLTPGYGWIFPMDESRANVGVLVGERAVGRARNDLRGLLASWLQRSPFARDRLIGKLDFEVRGGVIPSGRRRRVIGRTFLVGDAAGVADPFTAEGIYEAMRSGRLAARSLAESRDFAAAGIRYERELRDFDRNAAVARAMRATFGVAIEPYARHAAKNAAFADHLTSEVFFQKRSFPGFVWGLTRRW